ncbi:hypothetical protein [Microbacterium panaciterrae]|uniref:Uncharacterized protein n=1 Tax=Microbacterium panaciterrae TaxID=985759 RepID=A0ABP8P7P9_9MICO
MPQLPGSGTAPTSLGGPLESRHLGPIELDGGSGGGRMDAVVPLRGVEVPLRLEIDFPDRLDQGVIDKVDIALEALDFHDDLARQTIADGLRREGTVPARLFHAWADRAPGREQATREFLDLLRPLHLTITPDGGKVNRNRVVMDYGLADSSVSGTVTVRFVQPTGPELVPATRPGMR